MPATITVDQVAQAIRLRAGATNLPTDIRDILERLLEVAVEMVSDYAPAAPIVMQDEAVVLLCGYLYDVEPGAPPPGNPLRKSGAMGMLARYRGKS